jgi:hypothetical protein
MQEIVLRTERFTVGKALSDGWHGMSNNFLPLLGVMAVSFCVTAVAASPSLFVLVAGFLKINIPAWLSMLVMLFGLGTTIVVQPILSIGMIRVALKALDGDSISPRDLFNGWPCFWQYLVATLMFKAARAPAYLFFVIPGVYVDLSCHFYEYCIIDRGMGPVQGLRASWVSTKGILIKVMLMEIVLYLVQAVGGLLFVVGTIPALMVVMLARASMYRQIMQGLTTQDMLAIEGDTFAPLDSTPPAIS